MSDDMDVTGVSPVDPEGGPGPAVPNPGKGKGFFSTALGRVLLIGCGVAVILGIIGIVVFLVLGVGLLNKGPVTVSGGPGTAASTGVPVGGVQAGAASIVPSEPPLVPVIANRDVFSPRDPFEEIKPPVLPTETVTPDADVLVLKDIVTEDGVRKGVFTFNGVQYVGGPGDVLGTTNWKVLAVYESSADVLFGDDRVTLSVGQGIQK